MAKFTLTAPYWDGRILHPKGKVLPFEKGEAPKTAKPVAAAEPAAAAEATPSTSKK